MTGGGNCDCALSEVDARRRIAEAQCDRHIRAIRKKGPPDRRRNQKCEQRILYLTILQTGVFSALRHFILRRAIDRRDNFLCSF
jgi:hypothetical protein